MDVRGDWTGWDGMGGAGGEEGSRTTMIISRLLADLMK